MAPSQVSPEAVSPTCSPPQAIAQPAWLHDLLACPCCGTDGLRRYPQQLKCPGCGVAFSASDGIVRAVRPELRDTLADQQDTWRRLEKARGRYELPLETVLRLPEDPRARSALEWLRTVLRSRGACRVLELGGGRGWATRTLAEDGHDVVASDISDDDQIGLGCALRQRVHASRPFGCVLTPAEVLPFRPGSFECVFCCATLRHVPDLERVFREVSRVLRPGGFFAAFEEPFRGILTSQVHWSQDSPLYRLARGWIAGKLPDGTSPDLLRMRASIGTTVYDLCRRVPSHVAVGATAGFQVTVLPAPVLPSLAPDLKYMRAGVKDAVPEWLDALATAYGLDSARLGATYELAHRTLGLDLVADLLGHWTSIGNCDGVLLGIKSDARGVPAQRLLEADELRQLDPLFLACAPQGIVPIYGLYPVEGPPDDRCYWTEPHSGFLLPETESVELTITCPSRRIRGEPVRLEFRIEGERTPLAAFMMLPGKTITVKVPIPKAATDRPSLLLRLTANLGFLPSDFDPHVHDTRLLAVQLRSIRAGRVPPEPVETLLQKMSHARKRGLSL